VIRILLVDDQNLVRAGFRVILEVHPDFAVVGEAGDGLAAVAEAARTRPDVVLMDVRMPRLDGIEATRRIVQADPHVRVLILTTFDLDEYVYGAVRAGASGFLLKDAPPDELARGVRVVAAGEALLAPTATRRLLEEFARRPAPGAEAEELANVTKREREVLILVAQGLSNREIAEALAIGEATVKTHVARVLGKLGRRDRVQAVVFAYESGLLAPMAREGRTLPLPARSEGT